jgi:hypothetical protein
MITKTPDRIVELWPHLSEAARADLIARAETIAAAQPDAFVLSSAATPSSRSPTERS